MINIFLHMSLFYTVPKSTILVESSTDNITMGKPYEIQCSIHTSEKINESIVKIDWTGPDGLIVNDSRITIHSTISDNGTIHYSTLQFLYLIKDDIGIFTCNVTILDTNLSQTFQLDSISSKL